MLKMRIIGFMSLPRWLGAPPSGLRIVTPAYFTNLSIEIVLSLNAFYQSSL